MGITITGGKLNNVLCFLAAFFMPSILLFNLYNRNHIANFIVFRHVLVIAGILAVVGVLLFIFFKWITGSAEGALLITIIFWLCFWLFESLLDMAVRYSASLSNINLMVLLKTGMIFIAICLRRYEPPFFMIRPAFNMLAVCLIVLFFFNLMLGVNHELAIARARTEIVGLEEGVELFYIKRSFVIDPILPSPDIYWFHLDGMLSLNTMERFFGINQDAFRAELTQRGFKIYENGFLHATNTTLAFPALFSPAFYDSFYGEVLSEISGMLIAEGESLINNRLAEVGIVPQELMGLHELFAAFTAAGYEMVGVSNNWRFAMNLDIHIYEQVIISGFIHKFLITDFPDLLNLTTPLNFSPPTNLAVKITTHNADSSLNPSFEVIRFYYTHVALWRYFEQNPSERVPRDNLYYRYDLYPIAFERMTSMIINSLDAVLSENPNAVIVLQADHGFHDNRTVQHLLDVGYPMETILELMGSIFSAVRIPPEYGGLEAPIAPLNITRELVNRFVGENYTLLPSR